MRTDLQQSGGIDVRDAAPARADLDQVDRRQAHRQAAALLEALQARRLELGRDRGHPVGRSGRPWRSCRPCRRRSRPAIFARRAACAAPSAPAAGPDSSIRIGMRSPSSREITPPLDCMIRSVASIPSCAQAALDGRQIRTDHRHHIGVEHGCDRALVFAQFAQHLVRQRHRHLGAIRCAISRIRSSCAGSVKLCSRQTAIDSAPPSSSAADRGSRCRHRSVRAITSPPRRPVRSPRPASARGTTGSGPGELRS